MSKHKQNSIKKDQTIATFVSIFVFLVCASICIPAVMFMMSSSQEVNKNRNRQIVPVTKNTRPISDHMYIYKPHVNKGALIIQQNPDCWVAIPGVTCGPEKTYLGE